MRESVSLAVAREHRSRLLEF